MSTVVVSRSATYMAEKAAYLVEENVMTDVDRFSIQLVHMHGIPDHLKNADLNISDYMTAVLRVPEAKHTDVVIDAIVCLIRFGLANRPFESKRLAHLLSALVTQVAPAIPDYVTPAHRKSINAAWHHLIYEPPRRQGGLRAVRADEGHTLDP